MFTIYSKKRKLMQCDRDCPVFWVMHEIEGEEGNVLVDFLNLKDEILATERLAYGSPTERENTLKRIEQIRQAWIFKIC